MKSARKHFGFTLVEILVVVVIIAVLIGLALGLGKHIRQQANEKLAAGQIDIIVTALQMYYDFTEAYPVTGRYDNAGVFTDVELEAALDGTVMMPRIPGSGIEYAQSEYLYYCLSKVPNCRRLVETISESLRTCKDEKNVDRVLTFNPPAGGTPVKSPIKLVRFIDPWGNPLLYFYQPEGPTGMLTFPLIISAGADGLAGTGDDIKSR